MAIFTSRKEKRDLEVRFQSDMLYIRLPDGNEQVFPLAWFPKLKVANDEDRLAWVLTADGSSIVWHKLNEQVSVTGL
ncbi:MAG: DUF2442 domain-containing protein [Sphingobacteriaceae bacterium]